MTQDVTLSTALLRYTIDLTGQTYDQVIGGFAWIVTVPSPSATATPKAIVFYLDDMRWE